MHNQPYVTCEPIIGEGLARALAFDRIPQDATEREAYGWLSSLPSVYTPDDRTLIVSLHLSDLELRLWRQRREEILALPSEAEAHSREEAEFQSYCESRELS